MKQRRRFARDSTTGLIVTQKAHGAPKVTSEQIYAIEKGDPLVALANQTPMSARASAAFDRALEEGRRSMRAGGLSRAHARGLLRILMEHISEEQFCAGWHVELEFLLWEGMQKTTSKRLLPYERAGLKFLSGAACGWWTFDRFVSLKRWQSLYAAHRVAGGTAR